jgi:hypothetical protein
MGRTLWVSLEMPPDLVVSAARSCGARLERLQIATELEPEDLPDLAREHGCQIVGWDSISELEPAKGLRLLNVVRGMTQRAGFVLVICHATKDGGYRGPSTFGHAPDYLLSVEACAAGACITVEKSRDSARGSASVPLTV